MKVAKKPGKYSSYGHATVKKGDIRPWAEGLYFVRDGSTSEMIHELWPKSNNSNFVKVFIFNFGKLFGLITSSLSVCVCVFEDVCVDQISFICEVIWSVDVACRDSYNEYTSKMQELSELFFHIIITGLGVDSTHFERITKNAGGLFRWNYYPPCPEPHKTIGLKPHTDFNLLTILHTSNVGGLQIWLEGKWSGIRPRPML
ncbi:1-aminocyclopropane-1-carboxylate oxidase homolog 10 [Physcomitrium patens]|uniref:1-aminocyclopropane-1-carboxylate oxidase homolog 10 n=1 Tax=Physcomitrium patens TaxID=3218 RepID=UPI003CCDAC95